MRPTRYSVLIFIFIFAAAELSAGFLPKRRPTHRPKRGGAVIMQRGPSYSPATTSVNDLQSVQNLIQQSKPGVNDIAVQAAGLSTGTGDSCAGPQARVASITAELYNILAQLQAAQAAISGCGINASCISYWGNRAIALGNQAASYQGELSSLAAQLQACQSQGGGGVAGGAQVNPPGLTYANLAKRFKVPLKGGGLGGGGGSFGDFSSPAFDALLDDVNNGRIPDYDGRQSKQNQAYKAFLNASAAASAIGGRVEAGRAYAGKPAKDFDDPQAAAQQEYLRINYDVLGAKYEGLARERSAKADAYAQSVLSNPPTLPLPDDKPPLFKLDGELIEGVRSEFKGQLEGSAEEYLEEGASTRTKALISIVKIEKTMFEGLAEMAEALPKALAQMGSASLESGDIDAAISKADAVGFSTLKASQEEVSDLVGFNPNPENQSKDAVKNWIKKQMGVGGDD